LVFIVSIIMHKLKQPLLIGYIISGIAVGPVFLNLIRDPSSYETFSHLGVSLLLFIVGLHLNLKLIKEVGLIALVTGLGQVLFTSFFGFLIGYFLGFSIVASIFIAIALTFSSTIIIVKLLSDKGDLDKLYGKISMGFLIVQDFVAVFILMIISAFMNLDPESSIAFEILKTLAFGIISIFLTYQLSKSLLPRLLDKIAKSSEMLFIFIVAWCFGIAALFSYLGFSLEIGALLAGIAFASSNYNVEISSKVKPLRDFFIVMFFLLLGAQMFPVIPGGEVMTIMQRLGYIFTQISPLIIPSLLFSIFVLAGNPLIVMILMSVFRYSTKTGFLAGLTVAQISEFSLILIVMAQSAGFINSPEVMMVTFIGIITILSSTYMISHGEKLYLFFKRFLFVFEPKEIKKNYESVDEKDYEVLILGYNRMGYSLLKTIQKKYADVLVVDYNPGVVSNLKKKGIRVIYGDVSDSDLLDELNSKKLKLIISTVPDFEINQLILRHFASEKNKITLMVTANEIDYAFRLYDLGAEYVITPHLIGGHFVSTLIEKFRGNYNDFLAEKIKHINELKERKSNIY
ncbi:MAG: cation:proton antiporter, partial [Nanoarchaeota archaeon]